MRIFPTRSALRFALRALLVAPVFFVGETCTKLTEVPHDALTPTTAFHTDAEVLAGVAGVYAQLRNIEWVGFIILEDLTTDVAIVPTRGSDWYDNGQWLDLHRQTWTANSSGTLAFVDGAWNDLFSGVAKANLMIDVVTKAGGASKDQTLAELRTLRAWYYYMLQDMFGGVPLVTTTELKQYPRSTRKEIFSFIEKELTESAPLLPAKWDAGNYGRVTKGVANAVLASLELNAGVFNKDCGPADCSTVVNATAYNSCSVTVGGGKTGCQAAIDAANAVINSGTYTLNTNWFKNFSIDNKSSPENIFVIVHTNGTQAIGGNWPMRTLHYNQLNTGDGNPWNGFATTAETYTTFAASGTDERVGMWLQGPQKSFETGQLVNDRTGAQLNFTTQIPDADAATEGHGVRFNKFPPQPDPPHGSAQPNDFTFFRLAEMYLIRAEAENELGQTAAALTDLNFVHQKHDPTAVVAGGGQALRDAILKERLLELSAEGKRRTDMIRMGKFLSWTEASAHGHTDHSADKYRVVFPISVNALGSNPQLVQNKGY
jgi:starch-binding outer membrane protein, SusD/RagB family